METIRVNTENSKVVNGSLFITKLKATRIKNKPLQKFINWSNKITYPGLGEMVEYKGEYSRKVEVQVGQSGWLSLARK